MKVTLLAVVTLTAVASLVAAADPECLYRKLRGLPTHWPNPTNCASFYRCAKNTVRSINCSAGKQYNARTGRCSTAKEGLCKMSLAAPFADVDNACSNELNGTFVADPELCGTYYICNDNLAYPQTCDLGSYFDANLTYCVPDSDAECWQNKCVNKTDGTWLPSDQSCANYYICENNQTILQECNNGSYFNSSMLACVADEGNSHCWVNYCIGIEDGKMLRDTNNCSMFYICNNNTATMQQCPAGSYFDETLSDCIVGTCTENEPTTTTAPPSGCDCANGVLNGDMIPNEGDCRKYFTCVNGELVCGDCQQGNYFDKDSRVCERDTNSSCYTPECTNGNTTVKPEDCSQYYLCQNETWQLETCPSGSYFDKDLGKCAPDENNVCPQCNVVTATVATQSIAEITECQIADKARSVDNCWSYLACISGQWKRESCVTGYYFDAAMGICRRDNLNFCPENRGTLSKVRSRRSAVPVSVCYNRPNGYKTTNPEDCTTFITCNEGQSSVSSCPSGQWYSSNNCVIDVTGSCINPCSCGTGNATHPICSDYYQCTDGVPKVKSCPTGQAFDNSTNTCSSTVQCNANLCATAEDGATYMVIGDPSRFYVCIDNVALIRSCPENTAFDRTLKICMAQPSSNCDQTKCSAATINQPYASLNGNSNFCLCLDDGAYLESCDEGYFFDSTLGICEYTGPCNPQGCIGEPDYSVSVDVENPYSFCLCRAEEPVSVACPYGYTFNTDSMKCVVIQHADPRCCSTYCVGKPNDLTFEALNSNSGFCLCDNELPVYYDCLDNKLFDKTYGICLDDYTCVENGCNSTVCEESPEYTIFAKDTCSNGFCYCKDYCAVYSECPTASQFDTDLKVCMDIPLCNDTMCDTTPEFKPFESLNGTSGFCYCQSGQSVYKPCPDDKEFSVSDGVCLKMLDENSVQYCCADKCLSLPEDATFPSTNDCDSTSFCQCQGGVGIYENCPQGRLYNSSLNVCMIVEAPASVCATGKCATSKLSDYTYAAQNTTTGFCLCVEGLAVYESCPDNKEFEPNLGVCLSAKVATSLSVSCDRTQCVTTGLLRTFAAKDKPNGYCVCRPDGTAMFQTCANDHRYIESLRSCVDEVCDPMQCRVRAKYEAFPAKNTINGFCSCDIIPTYSECYPGTFFNSDLGMCLKPNALLEAACNFQKCKDHIQYEPFAASNTTRGFCSCDGNDNIKFHQCRGEEVFNLDLGICMAVEDDVTTEQALAKELVVANKQDVTTEYDVAIERGLYNEHIVTNKHVMTNKHNKNLHDAVIVRGLSNENVVENKPDVTNEIDEAIEHVVANEQDVVNEHVIEKRSVPTEEKFACQSNDKRSVPANCSQYEICLDGNWRRRICSEERYYNPEQQVCLEPRDDMVCNYARVSGLPPCSNESESETIANPHEKGNCMQYFRCAAGKWRLRSCPRLHYYAPHLSTCLPMPKFKGDDFCSWISRNNSGAGKCQHLSVRPYAMSCDRFLMCMEDSWWIQQCPLGMYFSREHNYCQPNDNSQCRLDLNESLATSCVSGQMRAVISSCRAYEQCHAGEWLRQTCLDAEHFEPLVGCVNNDGSCLGSGLRRSCRQGELRALSLSHSNCSQFFYYCDADGWQLVSCLRGHSFQRELGSCQSLETCQGVPKTQFLGSCKGLPDGQSVPHAEDCTRFYLCLQQQPALLQSCANGSFFDATLGYCRPNDGSCQPPQLVCGNSSTRGLVPHAQNCRAFYNCSNNSQLLYCPEGQYFDSALRSCRLDQGQCIQRNMLSDSEESLCTDGKHGIQLPHKEFCNLYYACVRGLAILAECEPNMLFNATAGRCAAASELEQSQCSHHARLEDMAGNSSAINGCLNLQDGSYVPDYKDCTRYYICSGGEALAQRCGLGAYFDGEQLLCLQHDGSCPYVNLTRNEIAMKPSKQLPPNPIVCEGKHGQIFPDPANCNNFYVCISNKLREERCYAGHFFNSTLQQCQLSKLSIEEDKDAHLELQLESSAVEQTLFELQLPERCNDVPTSFIQLCEVIGESGSTAEPGDCRRYISCDKKEPISQRCRNGESYDSLLGICRQNDGTCLMENGERVGVCNGRHGQLAYDEHSCRGYFVCVHGQKINAECKQGYYFSKDSNICQPDVLQQCSSNSNELTKSNSDE